MNNINDLKKLIKPLGFTILIKTYSFGKMATYKHIASGEKLDFNVFTPKQLSTWQPLFDFMSKNQTNLNNLKMALKIKGLIKNT